MPLYVYRCPVCGKEASHLKVRTAVCPYHEEQVVMERTISAPGAKLMETTDAFKGKSRQKDLTKTLRERSRNFARDHEADDMINMNRANDLQRSGFLTREGKKRKKIDDV